MAKMHFEDALLVSSSRPMAVQVLPGKLCGLGCGGAGAKVMELEPGHYEMDIDVLPGGSWPVMFMQVPKKHRRAFESMSAAMAADMIAQAKTAARLNAN